MTARKDLEEEKEVLANLLAGYLSKQDATPTKSRFLFDARIKAMTAGIARIDLLLSLPDAVADILTREFDERGPGCQIVAKIIRRDP